MFKPVISNEAATINVADITDKHIVYAIIDNKPCMLQRSSSGYIWAILGSTDGCATILSNNYYELDKKSITSAVSAALTAEYWNAKVAVFNSTDYIEAFQWLIDNCKTK